jgi:hypothetical protein
LSQGGVYVIILPATPVFLLRVPADMVTYFRRTSVNAEVTKQEITLVLKLVQMWAP